MVEVVCVFGKNVSKEQDGQENEPVRPVECITFYINGLFKALEIPQSTNVELSTMAESR